MPDAPRTRPHHHRRSRWKGSWQLSASPVKCLRHSRMQSAALPSYHLVSDCDMRHAYRILQCTRAQEWRQRAQVAHPYDGNAAGDRVRMHTEPRVPSHPCFAQCYSVQLSPFCATTVQLSPFCATTAWFSTITCSDIESVTALLPRARTEEGKRSVGVHVCAELERRELDDLVVVRAWCVQIRCRSAAFCVCGSFLRCRS